MKKLITIILFSLMLSSCMCVHKIDIEQGNVFTQQDVNRLRLGMTEAQVQDIMGTPTLLNTFNNNRVDYVYTFKPGGCCMTEKYVTLKFYRGILREAHGIYVV